MRKGHGEAAQCSPPASRNAVVGASTMILDAKTIKTLKLPPGKSDAIFFDDGLKGFGLRLRGDRRTWIAQYRIEDGNTRRLKIGDVEKLNAVQARDAAAKVLAKVTLGEDPRADKAKARRNAAFTLK